MNHKRNAFFAIIVLFFTLAITVTGRSAALSSGSYDNKSATRLLLQDNGVIERTVSGSQRYSTGSRLFLDGTTCANITTAVDLDACIQWANSNPGADTLTLGADITLSTELTHITSEITLNGNGHFVSGNNAVRVFYVESTGNLTLDTITVRDGNAGSGSGGGVYNNGTLTVTNSTFSGNSAISGGGIYNYYGTVTVTDSTLSGNSTTGGAGGGILNISGTLTVTNGTLSGNSTTGYGGGGIWNGSTLHGLIGTATVTNSTFSGNSTTSGDGGGIYNTSALTVTNSTFSSNSTTGAGGGIYNKGTLVVTSSTLSGNSASWGGGIYNNGTLTVTNSTLSGNSATASGGGIENGGGTLMVTTSTISGNSAVTYGGGIYIYSGTVYLAGTILDTGANGYNCTGNVTDKGYNLSDDGSCGFTGTGSQNNATLNLGALAYNDGGSTQTHRPGAGSAAIGAIPNGTTVNNNGVTLACNGSTIDQNGISRPRVTGGACASGAVEAASAAEPEIVVEGPGPADIPDGGTYDMGTTTVGTPLAQTITVRNTGTAALNLLTNPPTVSTGFTASVFGSTSVAAGGSTTFTLTCTATTAGSPVTGTLSFNNNDSDENPFNFTVTCTVAIPTCANITTATGLDSCIQWANTTAGPQTLSLGADITLSTALTTITSEITLNGNGHFVSGNNAMRVLWVESAGNLTLNAIIVRNGNVTNNYGGGIYNNGTLIVTDSTISENSATWGGGGIYSVGTLTVTNSTLSGNSATSSGASGGGILNDSTGMATVTNSTISGNTATTWGNGGGIGNAGTLTVTGSTISGNSATGGYGGYGGIFNDSGTLTVTNSTISGNSADNTGGIGNWVGGTLVVTNSTISGNQANHNSGGIYNQNGILVVTNSTISGNSNASGNAGGIENTGTAYLSGTLLDTGNHGVNCYGNNVTDNGYNLSDDESCGFTGTGSQNNAMLLNLGALAYNDGGSTQTHRPGTGSAAIGAIPNSTTINNNGVTLACNSSTVDQNGISRPRVAGGACTSGAVEAASAAEPEIVVEGPGPTAITDGGTYNMGTTTVGTPLAQTITVRNTGTATLNLLTNPPTITGAFTAGSFGSTSIAASGSTTFTLTCTAVAAGSPVTGTVSFNNNDGDENPFNFTVTCTVNAAPAPEIVVEGPGPADIPDGSTYNMGTTTVGTPLAQTITVRNTGTATLNLTTNPPTITGSFTAGSFGSTSIAASGSTTFTLTCTAVAAGSPVTGTLSFNNNDGDENPFNFTVACTVNAASVPEIVVEGPGPTDIPDGGTYDMGTTMVGTPLAQAIFVRNTGTAALTLTTNPPTITGAFTADSFGSTSMTSGGWTTFTLTCNATAAGAPVSGTVSFGNNDGDENPFNFAVTCTVNAAPVPEIVVEGPGPTAITDGGTYDIGTTTVGTPLARTITVRNTGTATLNLTTNPPTITGAFTAGSFSSTSIAASGSTTFTLTCNATAAGAPVSGTVSFGNNDGDENPFNFAVTCTVTTGPVCANITTATGLDSCIQWANATAGPQTLSLGADITLSTGLTSSISSEITLNGNGHSISGNNAVYVFYVAITGNLTLDNITVRDGTYSDVGGGIRNEGTLTVTNSTISGNSAGIGGGIYNAYGGTLMVTHSTFSGNSTSYYGGGIYNAYGGTLTVTNSTFSGNSADYFGGGISNDGTLTVTNSTFSGNSASYHGGGIYNNSNGTATVTHSTLSGNQATNGGGIFNSGTLTMTHSTLSGNSAGNGSGGGINNYGTLTVIHSTLSGNSADNDSGGGIFNIETLTVTSSTLSGNSASKGGGISNYLGTVSLSGTLLDTENSDVNCYNDSGTIHDNSYNLSDDGSCSFSGTGSQNNAMLNLDVLIYNDGGSTQTHRPGAGSAAIGAIPNGTMVNNNGVTLICDGSTTDQNDISRPRVAGGACASGAVEAASAAEPEIVVEGSESTDIPDGGTYDLGMTTVGTPLTQAITVRNTWMATLTLTNPPAVTGAFAAGSFGSTSVVNGASTTFNLTCNATTAGAPISGTVSFGNNDSNENPFNFTVTCTVTTGPTCAHITTATALDSCIQWANSTAGPQTLSLDADITLSTALTNITSKITLNGNGHFVSGNNAVRVFYVSSTGNLTLNTITVRNGAADVGGGISNYGTLTVTNSTLSGNSTTAGNGGGISNYGTLTVTGSTLSGNQASSSGGGGGGIFNSGTATVTHSTLSGNSANYGGSIYNEYGVTLTVTHSTFSGNQASGGAGGGGIFNYGTLMVTHSTLSGNQASSGSGGGISNYGALIATHSTLSGNSASWGGGGIFNYGTVYLSGTLLDTGASGVNCYNYAGSMLTDNGYNLSDDGSCSFSGAGSQNNATLNLGALAYNDGGSTQTHRPGVGSAAIGAIPNSTAINNNGVTLACNSSTTDQNDISRPRVAGRACASGSVEAAAAVEPEIVVEGPGPAAITDGGTYGMGTTTVGTPLAQTITVRNTGTATLNLLTNPPTVSTGFTASVFGSTSVAAGGSTTFTLTCTATAAGSPVSGTVSFNNNDSDENPFNFTVTCMIIAPEIVVEGPGSTPIADGSSYDLGTTWMGTPLVKTITVRNTGTATLNLLTNSPTVSTGFTASVFGSTSVAAGGSTTFTLTCTAAAVGAPVIGTVSFNNNDGDENPFNFTVNCTVIAPEIVVEGPGSTPIANGGSYNLGATTIGTPLVKTITVRNTGTAALNLLTNPPTVSTGFTASVFGSTSVTAGGSTTFTLTCTATAVGAPVTGTVSFNNNDGDENPFDFTVICTVSIPAPEIAVEAPGPTAISDGGTYGMGPTFISTPLVQTITVRNVGTAVLNLLINPPTVSAGFTAGNFGSTTVAAGSSTTFDLTCTAVALGAPVSGTVSFNNDDSDENPFDFTVNCTVVPPLQPPALQQPGDGALIKDNIPVFTWDAATHGLSYRIQIDNDADFSSVVLDVVVSETTYTAAATLADATAYHWRVQTIGTGGLASGWSTSWSFTIDQARPAAPVLTSPADRVNMSTVTPRFVWGKVTGATQYRLQVDDDPAFSSPADLGAATVLTNGYTVPALNALPYGDYYWRVQAGNAANVWSDWSLVRRLTVTLLKTPKNADHVTSAQPIFTWYSVTGATYEFQLANDAQFTSLVIGPIGTNTTANFKPGAALLEGEYFWSVRVTKGGITSVWMPARSLTVTPPTPIKPLLDAPANNALLTTTTPLLEWNALPGILHYTYQVQIALDASFKSPLQDATLGLDVLEYTATELPSGGKFFWRVRAINSAGVAGAWSTPRNFTLTQLVAPVPLTPLKKTVTTDTTPDFTWTGVTGAGSYQIQISPDTKFVTVTHQSTVASTGYTVPDGSALANSTYNWRVRAIDGTTGVPGKWSIGTWTFTVDTTGPAAPVIISPAANAGTPDTTPLFQWKAPKDGKNYHVQVTTESDPTFAAWVIDHTTASTSYTDATILGYGVYLWHVQAQDAAGNWGVYSPTVRFTVTLHKLPADGSSTINPLPTFQWNAVTGGLAYWFQLATDPGFGAGTIVREVNAKVTSAKPTTGLLSGTYYWRVSVNAGSGFGTWMPTWTLIVTATPPAKPVLLTPVSKTLTNDNTPTFAWNSVLNGNNYQVQIDNNSNFSSPEQDVVLGYGLLSYTAPTLPDGAYSWHVRALNVLGAPGAWSATWTLTIDTTAPATPLLIAPVDGASSTNLKLVLSWNGVTGAARYELQIDTDPAFALPLINAANKTTYTPPTPLNRAAYSWHVRAVDAAGNASGWSETSTFEIIAGITAQTTATPTVEPAVEPTTVPPTALPPADAAQTVESDDPAVSQTGTWTVYDTAYASGGRYVYSSGSPDDALTLTFTGSRVDVIYVKHPALGVFAIEIDGAPLQLVDSVASETEFGARVAVAVSAGTHTLHIYPLNGTVAIDAFVVEPQTVEQPPVEPTVEPTLPTVEPTIEPTVEPTLPPVEPTATPLPVGPVGVPFADSFESGLGWNAAGAWRFEAGVQGMGWFADSTQRDLASSLTFGTLLDLRTALYPQLSFWQKAVLTGGETVTVEVSLDGGLTWLPIDQQTNLITDWALHTVDLSAYRGYILGLRFTLSAFGPVPDGVFTVGYGLDELAILDVPPVPTAVSTDIPTEIPPTGEPTIMPTDAPTEIPPTVVPTDVPTEVPAVILPTDVPTEVPTEIPPVVEVETPVS